MSSDHVPGAECSGSPDLTDAQFLDRWRVADNDGSLLFFGVGENGGVWGDVESIDEAAGWARFRDGRLIRLGTKAPPVPDDVVDWRTKEWWEEWGRQFRDAMAEAYRLDPR